MYQKSDGSIKCGFVIEHGLDLTQAASQCAQKNSIIPEFPNPNDQQIVNIIKVMTASLLDTTSIIECCVKNKAWLQQVGSV